MLTHKKIWLIGASEGIGNCLARQLAAQGAVLALSARQTNRLEELKHELDGTGHLVFPVDVQDAATLGAAYHGIKAAWGAPDIVIYNAGFYEPMTAQNFTLPLAEKMMDINFGGALRTMSFILPDFLAANKGHIALVASIAAYRGLPGAIGYGASKAAMLHLAENIGCDVQGTAIKVQVVNPGFVRTRLTAKNNFHMPQIMEPEKAAARIIEGLKSNNFEIRFPWVFSSVLKILSLLPARFYFRIMRPQSSIAE